MKASLLNNIGISIEAEILTKFINPTKLTFSREGINII